MIENEVDGGQPAVTQDYEVFSEVEAAEKAAEVEVKTDHPPEAEPAKEEGEGNSEAPKKKGGYQRKLERANEEISRRDQEIAQLREQLNGKSGSEPSEAKEPLESDFDNVIDFMKAHQEWIADKKASEKLDGYKKEQLQAAEQAQLVQKVQKTQQLTEAYAETVPDYYEKVDPLLESGLIGEDIVKVALDYDTAPQIAYHLANHQADLITVLSLKNNPSALKLAFDTLDQHIKGSSAAVRQTKAAAPITPPKGTVSIDNTLPEDNYERYVSQRNKQLKERGGW